MAELVPDYKKASNLIRLSAALIPVQYVACYILFKETYTLPDLIFLYVLVGMLFGIALLVRREINWIKRPFLVLLGLGMTIELFSAIAIAASLFDVPKLKGADLQLNVVNQAFGFGQDLLSLYALFLLFVPNKKVDIEDDSVFDTKNVVEI